MRRTPGIKRYLTKPTESGYLNINPIHVCVMCEGGFMCVAIAVFLSWVLTSESVTAVGLGLC